MYESPPVMEPYTMYDYRPRRRNRLFLLLLVLVGFALGVQVERRGWLRGRWRHEPAEVEQSFEPFWETWHLVHEKYVDQDSVNNKRMVQEAILGMLASLGDVGHTTYLTLSLIHI